MNIFPSGSTFHFHTTTSHYAKGSSNSRWLSRSQFLMNSFLFRTHTPPAGFHGLENDSFRVNKGEMMALFWISTHLLMWLKNVCYMLYIVYMWWWHKLEHLSPYMNVPWRQVPYLLIIASLLPNTYGRLCVKIWWAHLTFDIHQNTIIYLLGEKIYLISDSISPTENLTCNCLYFKNVTGSTEKWKIRKGTSYVLITTEYYSSQEYETLFPCFILVEWH